MSYNTREYQGTLLTTTGTAQVFTGKGILHGILVGNTTATELRVFDMINPGTITTTGTVAVLKASIAENTYLVDMSIASGVYITSGAGGTYTVLWTK